MLQTNPDALFIALNYTTLHEGNKVVFSPIQVADAKECMCKYFNTYLQPFGTDSSN